ncbi:MAG: hypothetical protein WD396_00475 [Pseudohongiellaceae bacterium]
MQTRNLLSAFVLTSLLSPLALAADDGDLGATSTGEINVDLEVTDSVEISALNDIDFGTYGGGDTGNINAGDGFCVYVNGGDGYTITPTSSNGSFSLSGSSFGDEIDYAVKLVGAATGADAADAVSYNSASETFQGNVARDCGSADNAALDVSIEEDEIRAAATDTYSDTLILLVNPI